MTRILALAGGVGGAKLANGLAAQLSPGALTIVVNTGDDFDHLGVRICPDLDTVMYTLAGLNNRQQGWGIEGESWAFMAAVERLGGATWFRLGDQDMATHILRKQMLEELSLSEVTARLCGRLGVRHSVVPMSDDPVRSVVETDRGRLAFQDYFVRLQCAPRFIGIDFEGIEAARPSEGFVDALEDPELEAIVICPSNPLLSVKPILSIPGVRERLERRTVPVIAVSPFIGGEAVKGPAAKIMRELGMEPGVGSLVSTYGELVDVFVVSQNEGVEGVRVLETDTLMRDEADQARLAKEVIDFAREIR